MHPAKLRYLGALCHRIWLTILVLSLLGGLIAAAAVYIQYRQDLSHYTAKITATESAASLAPSSYPADQLSHLSTAQLEAIAYGPRPSLDEYSPGAAVYAGWLITLTLLRYWMPWLIGYPRRHSHHAS